MESDNGYLQAHGSGESYFLQATGITSEIGAG
jgi:hypothetical protein